MTNAEIIKEFKKVYERIYKLESKMTVLDYSQHEESAAKIDYLAMMTDVDMEDDEQEPDIEDK